MRFAKLTAVFVVAHFCLTVGIGFLGLYGKCLDCPDERFSPVLVGILMVLTFPLNITLRYIAPDLTALEPPFFALLFLCSILWGVSVALMWRRIETHFSRRRNHSTSST